MTEQLVLPKGMQAKHLNDADMLRAVQRAADKQDCSWAMIWDVTALFPNAPERVVRAKLRQLRKRKLLSGCDCGCRGDWELTNEADAYLQAIFEGRG